MRPTIYRRDGTPYPPGEKGLLEWARDYEIHTLRRVAFDRLANGVEVSTVWLGLDHNVLGPGHGRRPLIFETMLFVDKTQDVKAPWPHNVRFDRESIGEQWRYSTEEEALLGHKMQVKKWSKFKTAEQVLQPGE